MKFIKPDSITFFKVGHLYQYSSRSNPTVITPSGIFMITKVTNEVIYYNYISGYRNNCNLWFSSFQTDDLKVCKVGETIEVKHEA
jgi:hypothetical protein